MVIIVSQSGDTVVNANKIIAFGLKVTEHLTGKDGRCGMVARSYSIYVDYGTGEKVISNFYSSKEKAMKVLKEMTYAIQQGIDYSLPKDEDLE